MRAIYIGYQEGFEDIPGMRLFNIDQPGHPLHMSTVDEEHLNELGVLPEDRIYPKTEAPK